MIGRSFYLIIFSFPYLVVSNDYKRKYWQATLGDICQLPCLPKATGDPTKYLECVKQDLMSDRDDLGIWKLQECANGFLFMPTAKKCKSEKSIRKQEIMCESNKDFDFCPKYDEEYHIRKTTLTPKKCQCEEGMKECHCQKKHDILEPIKIIRKSRTTHQEAAITFPPRFRQMSSTRCDGNCAKTQMIIDVYEGLTALPPRELGSSPYSPSPLPQYSSVLPIYFHSPDSQISSEYIASPTRVTVNRSIDYSTRQPGSPSTTPYDEYSNRMQNYYNQNAYQRQLDQMNRPEEFRAQITSPPPQDYPQEPSHINGQDTLPCSTCDSLFQQPPSPSPSYPNWQQYKSSSNSNKMPLPSSQTQNLPYDYRSRPPPYNIPAQNNDKRVFTGKHGDTEYEILITQYAGRRGNNNQQDLNYQNRIEPNEPINHLQSKDNYLYNPYVQPGRSQQQSFRGKDNESYKWPCSSCSPNESIDNRQLNRQQYQEPSTGNVWTSTNIRKNAYDTNQKYDQRYEESVDWQSRNPHPNIGTPPQNAQPQGSQAQSLSEQRSCALCQKINYHGSTEKKTVSNPDGYNYNNEYYDVFNYQQAQPITPSPNVKCQLISTQQQYCPRNDQPMIQPQPCALVDGDSVTNAKYQGICSWMLDPLAEDPETKCNYLQCQPAPNNLFCGRWQRMPCAPATAFDVTAQVCVWNAMSIPGPLPPPGTTTTASPQFSPIKITIPLSSVNSQCSCKGGVQIGSCNNQYQCPGQSICQIGQSSSNTPCTVCCYYKSMME